MFGLGMMEIAYAFVFILVVIVAILAFFVPVFVYQIRYYVKEIKETQEKILERLSK